MLKFFFLFFISKKPELLRLGESGTPSTITRQDRFAQSIRNMTDIGNTHGETELDPFEIERDLFGNVDSPDTAANASVKQRSVWRQKLSRYLAFYVGEEGFRGDQKSNGNVNVAKLNWESLMAAMDKESNLEKKHKFIAIINYFLHLRLFDQEYDFDSPLERTISTVEERDSAMMGALLHFMECNDLLPSDIRESNADLSEEEREQIKFEHVNVRWSMMEQSREVCHMNTTVFLRLLQLGYFQKIEVSEENLVKLLTHALRLTDDYDILVSLLQTLFKLMDHGESHTLVTNMFAYSPFLHALGSILRFSDTTLLLSVANILLKLTRESVTVRKWIVTSEYARYILQHMANHTNSTQPAVCTLFCAIIKQCVDREETRQVLAQNCGGVNVLIDMLAHLGFPHKRIDSSRNPFALSEERVTHGYEDDQHHMEQIEARFFCSNQRLQLLESITGALWVFVADETVSGLAVNDGIIPTLLYIVTHFNCSKILLTHIWGIIMVIASYQAYKSLVVQSDSIRLIIESIQQQHIAESESAGNSEEQASTKSKESNALFYRAALGALLMLSAFSFAIHKMKENRLSSVLSKLRSNDVISSDAALVVILERLDLKLSE